MKLYGIVGTGGFGREVMPVAERMLKSNSADDFQLVFIDENDARSLLNNKRVMSTEAFFSHPADEKFFNIAIANAQTRKKIADFMQQKGAVPFPVHANNFIQLDCNQIAAGSIFCSFTTITSNVKIGKFFHANLYSYVGHDCQIGDYVTFAPHVHCNGNVIIEDEVYVGTGVIIKQGTPLQPLIIGRGAVLGMGAVVTKCISPFTTVVGNPARPFIKPEVMKTI